MRKIILSGYMGSGKTTVGRLLGLETDVKTLDLDEIIEKNVGISIPETFASKGEIYFRKLEHEALKSLLDSYENFILSLGGGTPCYAGNDQLLKNSDATWIYLKANPETLYQRLTADPGKRPLLEGKTPEEMKEYIAKNLFDRSYYYNQADVKIATDGKSPEEVVREIQKMLA
ncbi:MAG: shikimate kinase [Flavobacterium sp.]|nr:MAG: shikimate kinase [Flavobacterium sp.]